MSLASSTTRGKTLLIISQVFVPDPASVGQHIADVAVEMARRGHRVVVYTSDRGYENPKMRFPPHENLHGVDIRRLPFSSFGKKSILTRVFGTLSFLVQVLFLGLTFPKLGGILFSTSPPMIGIAATIIQRLRRVPTAYWAMDINPDQLIALGKLKESDPTARLLERAHRFVLRNTNLVIALDRFMAERLAKRANLLGKLLVMPPWPHEEHIEPLDHENNPFRDEYGLHGKFVLMYSGNHSPSNPLRTILDAAVLLKNDPQLRFLFVGGGLGKKEVELFISTYGLKNVLSLPYQPLSELRYSLSSADVHLVSLGNEMAGIIHPCKVYGAMAVAKPVLFLGPRPSHISDLLDRFPFGIQVPHGDVPGALAAIESFRKMSREELHTMGAEARNVLHRDLSQSILCNRMCDRLEQALELTHPPRLRLTETAERWNSGSNAPASRSA